MPGINADIIKIGNSHGLRIPKTVLDQLDLPGRVELEVVGTQLLIRPHGVTPVFPASSVSSRVGVKAVVIGGGTGSFMVLSALRHYVSGITAIVNMSDDGGSTGVLRDELGALPPGDVRQCLVALSNTPEYMRELFNYRFESGSLKGHAFGNIFLTALEKVSGDFGRAVVMAEQILNVAGRVIPVTTDDARLEAVFKDGHVVTGQFNLDSHGVNRDDRPILSLSSSSRLNPEAGEAIESADLIVMGPGDLYSSLIPAVLPTGMREALKRTPARKVFICNLVNKPQTTRNMMVHDYVEELERYIGTGAIDTVIFNTGLPGKNIMSKYMQEGEAMIDYDQAILERGAYQAIGENLIGKGAKRLSSDPIPKRSLIRHDGDVVARLLMRVYFS